MPEQIPPEPDAERSPFDEYVNNHLDFGGLGDSSPDDPSSSNDVPPPFENGRSSLPRPDWDRLDANMRNLRSGFSGSLPPFGDEEDGRSAARGLTGDERGSGSPLRGTIPPFAGRPFTGRSPIPFPNLDDPRWKRGTFEVVKDLRVHKTPSFAPSTLSAGSNVMVFTNAFRYDIKKKRLRYIPDIFPGWSAVHLLWEKPVLGYVNHSEVRLTPHTSRLQEHWSEVLLIAGLCALLLVAIIRMSAPPDRSMERQIEQLTEQIATLEARIAVLEVNEPVVNVTSDVDE